MDSPAMASQDHPPNNNNTTNNNNTAAQPTRRRVPIAICGIGLRLPGGVRHTDDFWDLLVSGRDARGPIPRSRFSDTGFDGALGAGKDRPTIPQKQGYFLADRLDDFDAALFSMSKAELGQCDPQQRLLLEVVHECLEDAGEVRFRGSETGCYVGTFGDEWAQLQSRELQHQGTSYAVTGATDLFLANRVSYEFDLNGPSMVIKTACSASLVALHEACRALSCGDASAAIVGGTSLLLSPWNFAVMNSAGVLSPDNSCKTFDAAANGYARAEGIASIYIKRLDDALRDGNPVRAVIRGTGTNSDGRTRGMTVPRAEAQERLMRKAYAEAGLDPAQTAYVECHGTGTPTGDPIEATAVGNVFGRDGVLIGSVKPAVGHGEGVAGLIGLIKAVLCIENSLIAPNIKFKNPNPKIPFREKKLTIPLSPMNFPKGKSKRISINSFGVGGSNAHAIVEALAETQPLTNGHIASPAPALVLMSAGTAASLKSQIQSLQDYVYRHPSRCNDVAYTRAFHRQEMAHRAFAIIENGRFAEVSGATKSNTAAEASSPQVAMIFTGQGAQWVGMGREMISSFPSFRQDLEIMDEILQASIHPPAWSLIDELQKPEADSRVNIAEISLPLSTALQVALVRFLRRLKIQPDAVVGHSSGETAAAYAAGHITLAQAVRIAYYRGYVVRNANDSGAMAAVGLGADQVSPHLPGGVVVACENSPESTTISGARGQVKAALAILADRVPGTFARMLKVNMAYHSDHMVAYAEEYRKLLQQEGPNTESVKTGTRPSVKFVSSLTMEEISTSSAFGPDYWVSNMVSPVRFSSAMTNLLAGNPQIKTVLEVGPHSALAGPFRQICSKIGRSCNYISAQQRNARCDVALLSAVGKLYQESVAVDLRPLFPSGKALSGLPTYPWDHSSPSALHESRVSKVWRERKHPHHCLLGVKTEESTGAAPRWRNMLRLDDVQWLADHKVSGDVVFPFAGYVVMAGEAIRQVLDAPLGSGYRCRNVHARVALILNNSGTSPPEIVTTLSRKHLTESEASDWFEFTVESYNGAAWVQHCSGEVRQLDSIEAQGVTTTSDVTEKELPRRVPSSQFYASMKNLGYSYTGDFAVMQDIHCSTSEMVASTSFHQPRLLDDKPWPFTMHPTLVDGCLQIYLLVLERGLLQNMRTLSVPEVVEDIIVCQPPDNQESCIVAIAEAVEHGNQPGQGQVTIRQGPNMIAQVRGIHLTAIGGDLEKPMDAQSAHAAARVEWLPDFDLMDTSKLIDAPAPDRHQAEVLQEMSFLCVLEALSTIDQSRPAQAHLQKFKTWLRMEVESARDGNIPLISNPARLIALSSSERQRAIEKAIQELTPTPWHAAALGVSRLLKVIDKTFRGEVEPLEILAEDQVLTRIYDATAFDYGSFVRCLSHSRPNLRILEVGAGTGGTTDLIIKALRSSSLAPFDLYTFTDISAGFFSAAKERFPKVPNMEYKVFDITKEPSEQGFDPSRLGSYDVIVATQVVHATPDITQSLRNIRSLLKEDGMLLLAEPDPKLLFACFIFGQLPGWWLATEKYRSRGPLVDVSVWDGALKDAGYTGAEQVVFDEEPPHQRTFAIVAKPSGAASTAAEGTVAVFGGRKADGRDTVESSLREHGWNVELLELGFPPITPSSHLILYNPALPSMADRRTLSRTMFGELKNFLRCVTAEHKVIWILPRTQIKCSDPWGAHMLGIARAVRSELSVQLYTVEMEHTEPLFSKILDRVLQKVLRSKDTTKLTQDMEFVVSNGEVFVGRFHPVPVARSLRGYSEPSLNGSLPGEQTTTAKKHDNPTGAIDVALDTPPSSAGFLTPAPAPEGRGMRFHSDCTYLIVGGTRGLGRSIATWLVERGARSLIFLSRSAGRGAEGRALMRELESQGCAVTAVAGSVSDMDQVQRAVHLAKSPIRGVFQLAMVLHDTAVADMAWAQWTGTLDPKVAGTWNLHEALLGGHHELDLFWMASSVNTVFDMPGQGNYQAANIFLQSFCQYRHGLGLPASVLDIAPINDVGYVSLTPEAERQIQGSGLVLQGEREFLDCLEASIVPEPPGAQGSTDGRLEGARNELLVPWSNRFHLTMGVKSRLHLDDPKCTTSWRRNPKMGFYHNDRAAGAGGEGAVDNTLAELLARAAEPHQGRALLAAQGTAKVLGREIGRKIDDLMLRPAQDQVDVGQSLADIGLDSLMAIELRRWFRSVLGVQLSVLEIMATASLGQLGELTAAKLLAQLHAADGKR